jgi:hypothetical protein
MCPFCFASIGLIVAGAASAGGLAALAAKMSRKKSEAAEIVLNKNQRRDQDGNEHG